jgi:hypothetical protein
MNMETKCYCCEEWFCRVCITDHIEPSVRCSCKASISNCRLQKQITENQFCYFCKKNSVHIPYLDSFKCKCSLVIDIYMCCDCYDNIKKENLKYIQKDINAKLLDPSKIVLDYFDNDIDHPLMKLQDFECVNCKNISDKLVYMDRIHEYRS